MLVDDTLNAPHGHLTNLHNCLLPPACTVDAFAWISRHTFSHTPCCCRTSHRCSSNQIAEGPAGTGAARQSQGVGEQTEAVVTGHPQSQTGFQEEQSWGHLPPVLRLTDRERGSSVLRFSSGAFMRSWRCDLMRQQLWNWKCLSC